MVAKIGSKHGLSVQDVEHACQRYRRAAWDLDAERGRRLLVNGPAESGREIFVVLYPTDEHGVFNIGTAMPASR